MTVLPKRQLTADEFQAWALKQSTDGHGKVELVDGHVVMQQAERAVHGEIKGALFAAMRNAIKAAGRPCFAIVDSLQIRIHANKVYQPDGLVYCGQRVPPTCSRSTRP